MYKVSLVYRMFVQTFSEPWVHSDTYWKWSGCSHVISQVRKLNIKRHPQCLVMIGSKCFRSARFLTNLETFCFGVCKTPCWSATYVQPISEFWSFSCVPKEPAQEEIMESLFGKRWIPPIFSDMARMRWYMFFHSFLPPKLHLVVRLETGGVENQQHPKLVQNSEIKCIQTTHRSDYRKSVLCSTTATYIMVLLSLLTLYMQWNLRNMNLEDRNELISYAFCRFTCKHSVKLRILN